MLLSIVNLNVRYSFELIAVELKVYCSGKNTLPLKARLIVIHKMLLYIILLVGNCLLTLAQNNADEVTKFEKSSASKGKDKVLD